MVTDLKWPRRVAVCYRMRSYGLVSAGPWEEVEGRLLQASYNPPSCHTMPIDQHIMPIDKHHMSKNMLGNKRLKRC